ncbi:MAG: fluoride efflux transporter CrcB [Sinomicrobium sp.]|nr:fluoride efflux transporter CrcB [Sinomicrobium sp.]
MNTMAVIAIGGALGAMTRYGTYLMAEKLLPAPFLWGTFTVNLAGSFLIGVLWYFIESMTMAQNLRLFLAAGFLGSFTTFSAMSFETASLLRDGRIAAAALYIGASFTLGILCVFGGYALAKAFFHTA